MNQPKTHYTAKNTASHDSRDKTKSKIKKEGLVYYLPSETHIWSRSMIKSNRLVRAKLFTKEKLSPWLILSATWLGL